MKPKKPASDRYRLVILLDSRAAQTLLCLPLNYRGLNMCSTSGKLLKLHGTVSYSQIAELAIWAASVKPNLSIQSPPLLRDLVGLSHSGVRGPSLSLAA